MGYVSLHQHSDHSRLDGLSSVKELVSKAYLLGQTAIAVTDHGVVSGHFELNKHCQEAGIKPLFGMEGYFTEDISIKEGKKGENYQHMTLIAMNDTGLKNLWSLSTEAFTQGLYYGDPRFDWTHLEKYQEGLIATSGCLNGCVGKFLNPETEDMDKAIERLARLLQIFGDRFYMELHSYRSPIQEKANERVIELSHQYNIPMIAVSDSHYTNSEDWELHELVTAIGMGKSLVDEKRMQHGPDQLALYSEEEMLARFNYLDEDIAREAINNTQILADRCDASIPSNKAMPLFSFGYEEDERLLKEKVVNGFKNRITNKLPQEKWQEYFKRLQYEMDIILQKQFAGYFLIVEDLINWSKDNGLLIGPARGSAGGSLLSYCLGITEVDPIKYNLIFERFLNPGRNEMPDIDIDFPKEERYLAKEYLEQKYGKMNIAAIGTYNVVGRKQAVRDIARGFGMESHDINRFAQAVENLHLEDDDELKNHEADLRAYSSKYPKLLEYIDAYVGHIRHTSTHAAGVVISKDSLLGNLPLLLRDDELVTQVDMHNVEELGFVKLDMLGLRTLSTLMRAYNMIIDRGASLPHFYEWTEDMYADSDVWDSIATGKNIGLFQIESSGFRQLAPRFRPRSIEDLAAMVAAYRPGLLDAVDPDSGLSMFELYMRRRNGQLAPTYRHPKIKTVTEDTYGCFLYQEEVMNACSVLAGYSLTEADHMRKIVGKKIASEMQKERSHFIEGCQTNSGMDLALATSIFEELEAHQRYSFNKSHSVGYAIIGYWTAYLKYYYPAEFMTACFQTNPDASSVYTRECRRLGIEVLGPDINESNVGFTLTDKGVIRYGLNKIKWGPSSKEIDELRPFKDIYDLEERLPKRAANKRAIENMALVGALDSLVDESRMDVKWSTAKNVLYQYFDARGELKKRDKFHKISCPSCFGMKTDFECWCEENDIDNREHHEQELLGIIISSDPLQPYYDFITQNSNFISQSSMFRGEKARVGGLISRLHTFPIKSGKNIGRNMCRLYLQLPDLLVESEGNPTGLDTDDDILEVVLFADQYDIHKDKLEVGKPVLMRIEKLTDGVACKDLIRLDKLENIRT